jgi:phosphoesterase RecJ-like protein
LSTLTEHDQILDELRRAEKLFLTTHEHPDGDALGSLLGMHEVLRTLGKDSVMFMSPKEFPLSPEYRHMALDEVMTAPPADLDERVVVFLDCGNIDRTPVDFLRGEGVHILNIDHHHDNTRFGTVNLVKPRASCTAEIVFELARELGVPITREIADPLYIALVTDTGRFSYENTTPESHLMAAELIEAGVEVSKVSRHLYANLPFARLQLLQHALANIHRFDGGQISATVLTRQDFEVTGADETDSEGVVDYLRSEEGTVVAVLVRARLEDPEGSMSKVSLRAADDRVDVSRIARALGGGGHRQAAGFSSALDVPELMERLRLEVAAQL